MQVSKQNDQLDLSAFKRCVVQDVERQPTKFEKILSVKEKKTQNTARCCLKGAWYDTSVSVGDIVSVQGVWSEERKMFLVTSDSGLIVTSPDTLVSGTSVVGSLFCARKSALRERFHPLDTGEVKMVSLKVSKVAQ